MIGIIPLKVRHVEREAPVVACDPFNLKAVMILIAVPA